MPLRWNCSMPPVPGTHHPSPRTISNRGEAYVKNLERESLSLQMQDMQTFTATETTLHTVPCLLPRFWFTPPVLDHTIWSYPIATLIHPQAMLELCMWYTVTMTFTQHMLPIMTAHQHQEGNIYFSDATNVQGSHILC